MYTTAVPKIERFHCVRFVSLAGLFACSAVSIVGSASAQTCKVKFQVVYLDRLNNLNQGIPDASKKDVEKRLSKIGDVCYAGDGNSGDLVMFIHTSPATFHGTRVHTDTSTASAAAASGDSAAAAAASSSSSVAIPYSVDYSIFVLDVELPLPENKFIVLHTVDQSGLYHTLYGVGYGKGKHPIPNAIEAAAHWIHDDYLEGGSHAKW